jgi:hypothetical protein
MIQPFLSVAVKKKPVKSPWCPQKVSHEKSGQSWWKISEIMWKIHHFPIENLLKMLKSPVESDWIILVAIIWCSHMIRDPSVISSPIFRNRPSFVQTHLDVEGQILSIISWAKGWVYFTTKNWDEMILPSGYVNCLLLKMAIEIVDLPIKNGDFP